MTLDAHSLEEMDREHFKEGETLRRAERAKRGRLLKLDHSKLNKFLRQFKGFDRFRLICEGI